MCVKPGSLAASSVELHIYPAVAHLCDIPCLQAPQLSTLVLSNNSLTGRQLGSHGLIPSATTVLCVGWVDTQESAPQAAVYHVVSGQKHRWYNQNRAVFFSVHCCACCVALHIYWPWTTHADHGAARHRDTCHNPLLNTQAVRPAVLHVQVVCLLRVFLDDMLPVQAPFL